MGIQRQRIVPAKCQILLPMACHLLSTVLMLASCSADDGLATASASKPMPATTNNKNRKWTTTERLLIAKATAGRAVENKIWINSTGRHYAFIEETGNKSQRIVVDGKAEQTYEECQTLSIWGNQVFYGDGDHYAYVGKSGKEHRVVLNGTPGPALLAACYLEGQSVLSEFSNDCVYTSLDGKYFLNGKQQFETAQLMWSSNGFAANFILAETHVAWRTLQFPSSLFLDGVQQRIADGCQLNDYSLRLWGDGLLAYTVMQNDKAGQHRLIVGDYQSPVFKNVFSSMLDVSQDRRHRAYCAQRDDGQWLVMHDDKEIPIPGDQPIGLTLSSDGKHWVCLSTLESKKEVVILDGQTVGAPGMDVKWPLISSDGSRVVCVKSEHEKEFVEIDGIPQPAFAKIGGQWIGKSGGLSNGGMVMSADGRHLAYMANPQKDGPWQVVVDKTPGRGYPRIDPQSLAFLPERNELVYIARDSTDVNSRKGRLVINGQEKAMYDSIAPYGNDALRIGPGFVAYVAIKDGAWYWIEERLESQELEK